MFDQIEMLEKIRPTIEKKNMKLGMALSSYSNIIKNLLDMESHVSDITTLSKISTLLKSFRIIEEAKESGGKLRANMPGVLAANSPIDEKKFETIINLKAGVEGNFQSTALRLDEESEKYIDNFRNSEEWITVKKVFTVIITNADRGDYNFDAKIFFATITKALNIVGEFVLHYKENIIQKTDEIKINAEKSLKNFLIIFSFVSFSMIIFIFYIIRLSTESIEIIKKIGEKVALEASILRLI